MNILAKRVRVVFAIIVVAVVAIIGYFFINEAAERSEQKARDAVRQSNIVQLSMVIAEYPLIKGENPKKLEDLESILPNGLPKDPLTNKNYEFDFDSSDGKTEICAEMEQQPKFCQPLILMPE